MRHSLGIDWKHERAISDWEAERKHDPSRGGSLDGWKATKGRYARLDAIREAYGGSRHTRKPKSVPLDERRLGASDPEPDERGRLALEAIEAANLTEREREIFLRMFAGESNRRIGEAIGCSSGWVSALRHQAMKKVREALIERGVLKRTRTYTGRATL